MNKKKLAMAGAVLCLAIGFAAISTTLYINGTATIKANSDNFKNKVIFTKAEVDANAKGKGASAVISSDGKTITFTTQEFSQINDTTTLTYTIANQSNYKAEFDTPAVVCKAASGAETDYTKYLEVTHGGALDGKTLDRSATKEDTMEVELVKSYTGDTTKSITYTCTIAVDAVEATN